MNEINPAERFILDTLREASPLRKMRDDDWAGLELRVSQVGLARLDGWYGDQVRKAIRQIVEKHPGQHDQSVHGGKKGRSAGSTASDEKPASGGGGGSSEGGQSADVKNVIESDGYKKTESAVRAKIAEHRDATKYTRMDEKSQKEALRALDDMEATLGEMKSAKSTNELADLRGKLIDQGSSYKNSIRDATIIERNKLYRQERDWVAGKAPKPKIAPPRLKTVLPKGFENTESDLEDMADTWDLPAYKD